MPKPNCKTASAEKATATLLVETIDELRRIEKLVSVADMALETLKPDAAEEIEDVQTLLVEVIGKLNVLFKPIEADLQRRRETVAKLKAA